MTTFDDELQKVHDKVRRYYPQFERFTAAAKELIERGTCLLYGSSEKEDYDQFLRLVSHVEAIWDGSSLLFRQGAYPLSLYTAIAALEETGKIGVSRFQLITRQADRARGVEPNVVGPGGRRGNPFYSHSDKHLLAAGAGAVVNNRLDRILGIERVCQFLDAVGSGAVERLRQSALYADVGDTGAILPSNVVERSLAEFYVVLAGELIADVLGMDPKEWERLLGKVQAFEREIGHVWE